MLPVLIVEDHPLVAEATGRLLAQQNELIRVEIARDATATLRKLEGSGKEWHRIFLDLDVPGAIGLSLAGQLRKRGLASRTCIISATRREDFVGTAKEWGFLGYIVKAIPFDEFQTALRGVLAGMRVFPADVLAHGASPPRLTERQSEILDLVRTGMSSKDIATHLGLAEGTVNNHIAGALLALDAGSRAHAVAKAIEFGLLRPGFNPRPADEQASINHRNEP